MNVHKGLEGIVAGESSISLVDGEKGWLVYRGYWARELAQTSSFEEVAFLLWKGRLPNPEEAAQWKAQWKELRELPAYVRQLIDAIPSDRPMMSVVQSAVAAIGCGPEWPPTLEQALTLTAIVPTIIAYRYRQLAGLSWTGPSAELDHTANYLYMLHGARPQDDHVRALDAYLVLAMEHGFNASTFAGRVIASTEAGMIPAASGAIGAMKGPLHGGAPSAVIELLEAMGSKEKAEAQIRGILEQGGRLMGFGHRVYKTSDPRALALREVTKRVASGDPWFELALYVEETALRLLEEYKPGRRLYTNVEFYAAAIMKAIGMPAELFTPTFTASRMVGWTAHILEQSANNRIYRPQSAYTGSFPSSG
ncbi:citrate synthase/methylcitrate synthase [Paenibacillus silviterrae]|uniref:citrate synthase/methylcitrate synthase n=1 Tax=Paenibacillus silviterrae TaxID=3242194 RepID=UPI0025439419|nr:citrate synthase/methylcitrate synthase [Paenibacillus chinjuensis]